MITFYLLGFGLGAVFYGPLADRFGRKPLLIGCMVAYALFGALAGLAGELRPPARRALPAGRGGGGTRVLVVAIVRDRFKGSAMAQIMSLAMIIFMIVPVPAPAFGQACCARRAGAISSSSRRLWPRARSVGRLADARDAAIAARPAAAVGRA